MLHKPYIARQRARSTALCVTKHLLLPPTTSLQEASECLRKHTHRIKVENHRLRQELQELIDVTNALQQHKKRLERQYRNLLREHQFSQNLKQMRGSVFKGQTLTSELQLGELEPESEVFLPQLQ